jgi:hypothetical protein
MHHLTERSTKDAAAVKVLTVITLIYLPTTIVAVSFILILRATFTEFFENFFSTQFVQTNDAGIMRLSNNAWLLAAIAIPLTVLTVGLWGAWVYFMRVTPPPVDERPNTFPAILRQRSSSFKSILSSRKNRQSSPKIPHTKSFRSIFPTRKPIVSKDLEAGIADPEKVPGTPPPPPFRNPATTWSSTATTVTFR